MQLKAHFVSDLHLWNLSDERTQVFLRYLDERIRASDLSHLFLLGDIFDLWIGDHQVFVEHFHEIVERLKTLTRMGVEIHYFEGNHDLHLTKYWSNTLGIKVHQGPIDLKLGPHSLHIEHGDQMDPEDRGYHFLRWFLRTWPMKVISFSLPGRVVRRIGERASEKSRRYTSEVKVVTEAEMKTRMHRHAEKICAQQPFDFHIHGHVHIFDDYQFECAGRPRRSVNLGSWLKPPYRVAELTVQGLVIREVG